MLEPGRSASKDNRSTGGFGVSAPSITLPKGGGAIRGMGEKFAANPVTGTGSMSVPIATSPGRSGFGPQLSLSYDSGAGNGPFGFGWSLSLPSITRKTDKGLPRYRDADEADGFILSGAEDLVPVLVESNGQWQREVLPSRTVDGTSYLSSATARASRDCSLASSAGPTNRILRTVFWRSISKDNITTWYGKTTESRIADPADPTHIFSWLICESHDDKGNVIVYEYKEENSDGIDLSQAHERNRTETTRSANRYLKRIHYGNRAPYLPILSANEPPTPQPGEWLFEVVFDYGEHDLSTPTPNDSNQSWPVRRRSFSTYRAGFEVRTYRLCQRVLMFHHFPERARHGQDCLVRSTDFTYSYEQEPDRSRNPIFSFLLSVTQSGYKRQADGCLSQAIAAAAGVRIHATDRQRRRSRRSTPRAWKTCPYGLDDGHYQWVDLDGEGLSGSANRTGRGGWFYKRNLSPINR